MKLKKNRIPNSANTLILKNLQNVCLHPKSFEIYHEIAKNLSYSTFCT